MQGMLVLQFNRENYTSANVNHQPMIIYLFSLLFIILLFFFCTQGLFHPARRVREAYWKIYNTLYIGSQVS